MSAGVSSSWSLRSGALRRNIVHFLGHRAYVHNMGVNTPLPANSMLARANRDFEAKQAALPPAKAPAKASLAKELFPSSSPIATKDGNIENLLKQPRKTPAYSMFSRSAMPSTDSLKQRSTNIPRPESNSVASSAYPGANSSFPSLYNKSDSFRDEEAISLVDNDSQPSGTTLAGVYFEEGDFEDDLDLDLSYEAPSALPSLPKAPAPKEQRPNDLPTATIPSTVSWSQSSPSHYLPPQQSTAQHKSSKKRESLDDSSSPLPVAKKRTVPWSRKTRDEVDEEDGHDGANSFSSATPPSKKAPWDATASAVKAQKRQLKNQQKKPEQGIGMEEIQEVIKSHSATSSVISLSNEQRHVKGLVVDDSRSVFFTGPAGTGKSVLMRSIIQDLKKKYARDPERIAVTASTGLAACNIGGMTLHSFAGIGLGKEEASALVKKIRRNPKAKNRWLRTKILIIDEISMVDGELFDKLSHIGSVIRNNGRPWGGIQLVITGDFFQLPPVPDSSKQRDAKFAFEAATWSNSIDHTIGLTEVFRQRDPVFAQMLNEMRLGRISDQTTQKFKSLCRPLQFDDGLEVTELFPTRNEVENSNERRLRALPGKSFRFESYDSGDPAIRDRLLQNMMAPKVLELKKGAQVMLIKNMDETLVNGSLGTVTGFMSEKTFELMGIGSAEDDTDLLSSDGEHDAKVKKRIKAFATALGGSGTGSEHGNREFPLVRFHAVDGSERVLLCIPEEWKVELPTGEVQAARKQLPLILAWALSIHKAQGQTLERVKVDLGKVFEKGQAYVALSRATTQQGLQVLRFQKDKVMAHPRVVTFYNQLYSVESVMDKKQTNSISNFAYKKTSTSETSTKQGKVYIDLSKDEKPTAVYA